MNQLHASMVPLLDPKFIAYFNEHHLGAKIDSHQVPLADARANPGLFARPWSSRQPRNTNTGVYEIPSRIDGTVFKVKAYYPDAAVFGPGPYAVHLNFHGGGWVFGGLESDATFCDKLRSRLPIVVIDVDYRLCPESQFGVNIEDALSSLLWVREKATELNVKRSSISIGGTSSGAHIACVLQHIARDRAIPLRLLVAATPPVADHHEYREATDSPWKSYSDNRYAPFLSSERMTYFSHIAFAPEAMKEITAKVPIWWISPLRAPNFHGLGRTFILTAECDPLRDEGEGYGKLLLGAGNHVSFRRYLGVPHSFMKIYGVLDQEKAYMNDITEVLESAHRLERAQRSG